MIRLSLTLVIGLSVISNCDEFFKIRKNEELNRVLRKNQGIFKDKIKMQLLFGKLQKDAFLINDCIDLSNLTTTMDDNIEGTFYNIKMCGLENRNLVDFQTELEFGAALFEFNYPALYFTANTKLKKFGSQKVEISNDFRMTLEDVSIEGATGLVIVDDLFQTSTWTQDITVKQKYLEWNSTISNLKPSNMKQIIDATNPLGRYLKYQTYKLIQTDLSRQLNSALHEYPIVTNLLNANKSLLGVLKSQVLVLSKFTNDFIDNMLSEMRIHVIENDMRVLPLPEFQTQFSKQYGVITVWGSVAGLNGFVSDLSTILRTANFTVLPLRKSKLIKVFGAFGLEELNFGYDQYEAKLWNIGPSGRIEAKAGENSLAFYLKGGYDPKKGTVDIRTFDVKVVKFEDVDVKATGLPPFNWLYSRALTLAAQNAKDSIIEAFENQMRDMIQKQVENGFTFTGFETFLI